MPHSSTFWLVSPPTTPHYSPINTLSFSTGPSTGAVFATGGDDKTVCLYRVGKEDQPIHKLAGNASAVVATEFSPNEQQLLSASSGGSLKIFDLTTTKVTRSLNGHLASPTTLSYHPFGDFIASGANDTNVKLWDVRHKRCIQTYKGHGGPVSEVRFSPDGQWVASCCKDDGTMKVWDLVAGKLLTTIPVSSPSSPAGPSSLTFNPTEFLTAVTCGSHVKVFDMETFKCVDQSSVCESAVHCMQWRETTNNGADASPRLLIASDYGVREWEIDPECACVGGESVVWGGNNAKVRGMAINEGGQIVCGVVEGESVSVWVGEGDELEKQGGRQGGGRINTPLKPATPLKSNTPVKIGTPVTSSKRATPESKSESKRESKPSFPSKYQPPKAPPLGSPLGSPLGVSGLGLQAVPRSAEPPTATPVRAEPRDNYSVETPPSSERKSSGLGGVPRTHYYDSSPECVVINGRNDSRNDDSRYRDSSDDDITNEEAIVRNIAKVGLEEFSPGPSSRDSSYGSSRNSALGHIYDFAGAMGAAVETPTGTPVKAEKKEEGANSMNDLMREMPRSQFAGQSPSRSPPRTPRSPRRPAVESQTATDDGVIGQILLGRLGATSCLGERLEKMNKLKDLWSHGDVAGCLTYCTCLMEDDEDGSMEGSAVVSDFLKCIKVKSKEVMKLTHVTVLMKVLVKVLLPAEDSENPNDATLGSSTIAIHGRPFAAQALEAAAEIVAAFGGLAFDTCGRAPGVGVGVDMEREKRFDKCWGLHEQMKKLCDRLEAGGGGGEKGEEEKLSAIRFVGLIDLKDKRARAAAEKLDALLRKYKRGLL